MKKFITVLFTTLLLINSTFTVCITAEDDNESLLQDNSEEIVITEDNNNTNDDSLLDDQDIEEPIIITQDDETDEDINDEIGENYEDTTLDENEVFIQEDTQPILIDTNYASNVLEEDDIGSIHYTIYSDYSMVVSGTGRYYNIDSTYNSKIVTISIGNGITSICDEAFYEYSELISIALSNSLISIGDEAFKGCTSLKTISIPDTVTSIGDYAFSGCGKLKSISLSSSLSSIGKHAFEDCVSLLSISIPDGVTVLEESTFSYCSSLKEVELSSSLKKIYDNAFEYCSSLESIVIPDSVSYIGKGVFDKCTSLSTLQIPFSLSFYDSYFGEDVSLSFIYLTKGNGNVVQYNNVTCSNTPWYGGTNLKVVFEEGITSIGNYTFYLSNVVQVEFPNSLISIGDYAFYDNISLKTVVFGQNLTSIGEYAFMNCVDLSRVIFSPVINSIGFRAFYGCSKLFYAFLPTTLQYIEKEALISLGLIYTNSFARKTGWNSECFNETASIQYNSTIDDYYDILVYNIKFNGNGSTSGTMSDMTYLNYNENVKLKKNAFSKDNCTFVSWNTQSNGSGISFDDEEIINISPELLIDQDIILYAQWFNENQPIDVDPDFLVEQESNGDIRITSDSSDILYYLNSDEGEIYLDIKDKTYKFVLDSADTYDNKYEVHMSGREPEYAYIKYDTLKLENIPSGDAVFYIFYEGDRKECNINSMNASKPVPGDLQVKLDNEGNLVIETNDTNFLNGIVKEYGDELGDNDALSFYKNNKLVGHTVNKKSHNSIYRIKNSNTVMLDNADQYDLYGGAITNGTNGVRIRSYGYEKTNIISLDFENNYHIVPNDVSFEFVGGKFRVYSNDGEWLKQVEGLWIFDSLTHTIKEKLSVRNRYGDCIEFYIQNSGKIELGSFCDFVVYCSGYSYYPSYDDYIVSDCNYLIRDVLVNSFKGSYDIYYYNVDYSNNPNTIYEYNNGGTYKFLSPTKDGYTFNGWYKYNEELGTVGSKITSISSTTKGDLYLYAKWTPNTYKITYSFDMGLSSVSGNPTSFKYSDEDDERIYIKNPATKGASSFAWYEFNKDGEDVELPKNDYDQYYIKTNHIGDYNLIAKAEYKDYEIKYVSSDEKLKLGSFTDNNPNPKTYKYYTPTITLQNPTLQGYTFLGWYNTATNKKVTTIKKNSTSDITLEARWSENKYKLAYNLNGGKGTVPKAMTYYSTDKVDIDENYENPTRIGYTFLGWSTDKKATEADKDTFYQNDNKIIGINGSMKSGSTVTLYAIWKVNTYSVTFKSDVCSTAQTLECEYGKSYTLDNSVFLRNDNYVVGKWTYDTGKLDKNGNPVYKTIAGNATIKNLCTGIEGDKQIVLSVALDSKTGNELWTSVSKYSITYNLNGGTNNKSNPKTYQVGVGVVELKAPTRKGYTFLGWYDNPEFTGSKIENINTNSYGNKILYAKWELTPYNVVFISKAKDVGLPSGFTYYITSDTITLSPAIKSGYTFNGWYTLDGSETGKWGSKITTIKKGSTNDYSDGLYAKFSEGVSYTITYDANGGTGKVSNTSVKAGKSVTLQAGSFKYPNKVFRCWNTMTDGSGYEFSPKQVLTPEQAADLANSFGGTTVTLYAIYDDAKMFNIRFFSNGGYLPAKKNMTSQQMTNDAYKALKANAYVRDGYIFKGWALEPGSTEVVYKDKAVLSNYSGNDNGTINLFAVWEPITYTVKFNANGGKGSITPTSIKCYYDKPCDLSDVTVNLTKNNLYLSGWNTNSKGTGTFYGFDGLLYNLSTKNNSTVTLYAQWESMQTINVFSFTDEIPGLVKEFIKLHPEYNDKFKIKTTIIATTDGLYQPYLDEALSKNSVDIYGVEASFAYKYTKGDASQFAASYDSLGINTNKKINDAQIAPYCVQMGTRPSDNKVVGLGYQSTSGAFIYRRSIAKAVFGSDDPATVAEAIGAGSGSWDKFWEAAAACKAKGYKIVSGDGDVWHSIENSSSTPWIVNGKLNISAERENFLDISKKLYDNNYENDTSDWTEAWYADMTKAGTALGFYGPCWFVNYTMAPNCGKGDNSSWGDWAVCAPNIGFFLGGTMILAGTGCIGTEKQQFVKEFIEWATLDTSHSGLQYQWATGGLDYGSCDTVPSNVVMSEISRSDYGKVDFCNNQNIFNVYYSANNMAKGNNLSRYDERINVLWRDQVRAYAHGYISRNEAIYQFKQNVAAEFDIIVE